MDFLCEHYHHFHLVILRHSHQRIDLLIKPMMPSSFKCLLHGPRTTILKPRIYVTFISINFQRLKLFNKILVTNRLIRNCILFLIIQIIEPKFLLSIVHGRFYLFSSKGTWFRTARSFMLYLHFYIKYKSNQYYLSKRRKTM